MFRKIFYTSQAELDKSQQKFFDALTNWYEDKQYIAIAKTKLKKLTKNLLNIVICNVTLRIR